MKLKIALLSLLLATGNALAKDEFHPFKPTTPPLVAFNAWHQAVVKNDYAAYLRISEPVPEFTPKMARTTFDQLHRVVPKVLKITALKPVKNTKNLQFHAVGCTNKTRQMSNIILVPHKGEWRVFGIIWGPPWTKDVHDCPV